MKYNYIPVYIVNGVSLKTEDNQLYNIAQTEEIFGSKNHKEIIKYVSSLNKLPKYKKYDWEGIKLYGYIRNDNIKDEKYIIQKESIGEEFIN